MCEQWGPSWYGWEGVEIKILLGRMVKAITWTLHFQTASWSPGVTSKFVFQSSSVICSHPSPYWVGTLFVNPAFLPLGSLHMFLVVPKTIVEPSLEALMIAIRNVCNFQRSWQGQMRLQ